MYLQIIHSKHQVIIYDNNSWGGLELENTQCYLEERIITCAFRFDDNNIVGFICVYEVAYSFDNNNESDAKSRIRKRIKLICKQYVNRWKNKDPNIKTIIMGDFQDTITTSDRDNQGNFRKECHQDSIVNDIMHTHTSIVPYARDRPA